MLMLKQFLHWCKNLFKKDTVPTPQVPQEPEQQELPLEMPATKRMKTNMVGLLLITKFEGFYSEPYLCPAGVPTIGYGTIRYPDGRKVTLLDPPCTKLQALDWFRDEISTGEEVVLDFLDKYDITLNINQFSALMSFVYNLGTGIVTSKNSSIHKALVRGELEAIPSIMKRYNKARNKFGILRPLRGLTKRRIAEGSLWKKEVSSEEASN